MYVPGILCVIFQIKNSPTERMVLRCYFADEATKDQEG